MKDPIDQAREALCASDAGALKLIFQTHPELKTHINEPIGPFDSPPIIWAKTPEMLDLLLEAGADINARSKWWAGGFGLLDQAPPELAAYAIQRGAVVDIHAAARLGDLARVEQLLAEDPARVHARGGDGQTPLHFASTREIAACLLDHGADIDALDLDHESTPAQYMIRDRQEIARFLVSRGSHTELLMAAALGDEQLVRQHLDADPKRIWMSVSDEWFPKRNPHSGGTIYIWTLGQNATPYSIARRFGHDKIAALLLERSPPSSNYASPVNRAMNNASSLSRRLIPICSALLQPFSLAGSRTQLSSTTSLQSG